VIGQASTQLLSLLAPDSSRSQRKSPTLLWFGEGVVKHQTARGSPQECTDCGVDVLQLVLDRGEEGQAGLPAPGDPHRGPLSQLCVAAHPRSRRRAAATLLPAAPLLLEVWLCAALA